MTLRTLLAATALLAAGATAAHAAAPADTLAAVTAGHISATMTARDAGSAQWFFAMAPDDVMPLLPANTRLDMLDYYNSGLARPSRNAAGGEAMLTSSADRRLTFVLGDSTTCELAVFAGRADTIVALIETIRFPMADSRISWFDGSWSPVAPPVAEPRLADWLTPEGRRRRSEAEAELPFITAEATADPDSRTITFRRTIDSYFLPQQAPAALGLLRPSLTVRLPR